MHAGSSPQRISPVSAPVVVASPAEPAGGAASAKIRWSITSQPSGAAIFRKQDGFLLGHTPWQLEPGANTGDEEVRIVAPGFQEQTITLSRGVAAEHQIILTPRPAPSPALALHSRDVATKPLKVRSSVAHKEPDTKGASDSAAPPKVKNSDVLED